MHKRRLLQTCGAALLLALTTASQACAAPEKGGSPSAAKRTKLLRVTVYTWGLDTGRITFRFTDLKLHVLSTGYSGSTISWGSFETRVTQADVNALRRVIPDAELRSFKPEGKWFREYNPAKFGIRDGGTALVVTWDDQELALILPPEEVCTGVPPKAKRTYRKIELIIQHLQQIERKYAGIATIRIIKEPTECVEIERLHSELDGIWKKSLPKGRKGW